MDTHVYVRDETSYINLKMIRTLGSIQKCWTISLIPRICQKTWCSGSFSTLLVSLILVLYSERLRSFLQLSSLTVRRSHCRWRFFSSASMLLKTFFCTKSGQERIIKIKLFFYYCHIFEKFNPNSHKREKASPLTP